MSETVSTLPRNLTTIQEAADRVKVAPKTVRLWVSKGLITGYRLPGSRAIRVSMAEIESKFVAVPTVGNM